VKISKKMKAEMKTKTKVEVVMTVMKEHRTAIDEHITVISKYI